MCVRMDVRVCFHEGEGSGLGEGGEIKGKEKGEEKGLRCYIYYL